MRKKMLLSIFIAMLQVTITLCPEAVRAQAGFEDDRVMLQGFYWESYRHGHPDKFPGYGTKRWYQIVAEQAPAIRQGRFDLIWLPPPSFAGAHSAGYNPKEYFNLSNSYGDLPSICRCWRACSATAWSRLRTSSSITATGASAGPISRTRTGARGPSRAAMIVHERELGCLRHAREREGRCGGADRSSTRRTAGPLTNTAHFGISTTRASAFAATSYVICSNSRARATAAGGTIWSMAIMPGGSPCTIGPPLLRFLSENTTGTNPMSSGAGSGIRRPSRVASTQPAACSTS